MKTFSLFAAAILAGLPVQTTNAQDDLDSLAKAAATPTPAPAASPATAPRTATATQPSRTTAAATPRPTTAPAAPRESMKEQLAHGRFVGSDDLASMAGKKVPGNVYLTGTFRASGNKAGGRTEFDGGGGLFGGTTVHVFVRFPTPPNPKLTAQGYSSRWEKAAPLRVERVENTPRGLTVWTTDITAP